MRKDRQASYTFPRAQLIPDTYVGLEYTTDTNPTSSSSWTSFGYVYTGTENGTDEDWYIDQARVGNLASATAIRLTELSSSISVANEIHERAPRVPTWSSETSPSYPSGYTFKGLHQYDETSSAYLAITFALASSSGGSKLSTSTWYNPTQNLIGLTYNTNSELILTQTSGSYEGSCYVATSTYTEVS